MRCDVCSRRIYAIALFPALYYLQFSSYIISYRSKIYRNVFQNDTYMSYQNCVVMLSKISLVTDDRLYEAMCLLTCVIQSCTFIETNMH